MGSATSQSKNTGNENFLTTSREPLLELLDKIDEQGDLEVLGKQVRRKQSPKEESSVPVGRSVIYEGVIPTRLLQGRGKGGNSNDDVSDSDVLAEADVSSTTKVAIRRLRLGEESGGREDYWKLPKDSRRFLEGSRNVVEGPPPLSHDCQKEVRILSDIRHPRLVRLLGCCTENREALLIYEFMEGGDLGSALFHSVSSRDVLTWRQRLTIALDAARGLECLHAWKMFHRDFRPETVFLDKNNHAKVGGLSCAYVMTADTCPPPDQRVVGRIGYICPAYLETGQISSKLDVFSFGVTLLQLLSGRKAVMDSATPGQSISLPQLIERPELDLLPPALRDLNAQEASEEAALDTFASLTKMRAMLAPITAEAEQQKAANGGEDQEGEGNYVKPLRKSGRGADAYHQLECADDDVALGGRSTAHWGAEVDGMGKESSWVGGGWGVGHGMNPKAGGSREGGHWALANEEGGGSDVEEFEEGLEDCYGEVISFEDFMDPRLVGEYDEEISRKVVALAAECVQRRPSGRPEMDEVANVLERLLGDVN